MTQDTRSPLGNDAGIECVTMPRNPSVIVTDEDVVSCGVEVEKLVATRPDAGAIIIACYAQPGLLALRRTSSRPVAGRLPDVSVAKFAAATRPRTGQIRYSTRSTAAEGLQLSSADKPLGMRA